MHKIIRILLLLFPLISGLDLPAQENLPPERQKLISQLRDSLKKENDPQDRARMFYEIGTNYTYYSVDSSVHYHELAMQLFDSLGFVNEVIICKSSCIEQLYIKGELWRSIQYAYDVEEFLLAKGDSVRLPSLYNSMGNNLKRQKDWRGAMAYYTTNLDLAPRMKQLRYLAFAHMNLGECYWNLGILDSALLLEKKSLQVMKELKYNHQGFVIGFIGRIQYDMGDIEEAFKNMKKGSDLSIEERGVERMSTTLFNNLAECYLKEGMLDSAIYYGNQGFDLSSKIPVLLEEEKAAEILASAYEKAGNTDSAFHYLKILVALKDEIDKTAELVHARELKAQDETKKEEILHMAELNEQEDVRNIFIGSTILIFLLAGGIYARMRYIRKTNLKLEKAKSRAERSEAFKQQFLANMSHEIRTPMNAILGMTNLALDTELSDKQHEYLSAVRKSSENLLVIINDILDLSKLEAGKMDLELIPFNLKSQIQVVYDTLRFKAEEKGLDFKVDIDHKVPAFLKGDPYRLNQVLINLCGNSIKFTDKGSVRIEARTEGDGMIRFAVQDTGIGISKEKADNLFRAFQQADESTARKYGGTGLGLSISKTLVEMQKGQIGMNSEEGEGSEFYFTLPMEQASPQDVELLERDKQLDVKSLEGIRILLAEDNKFNQVVLHDTIKHMIESATVDIAQNGLIAIKKINSKEYDVVLMDVNMPEMSGHEATRAIRQMSDLSKKDIPILALTASILSDDIKEFSESGMNDYIPKPFTREELITTLAKYYVKG